MIKIREAKSRGYFDHGWLQTFHTFSFADYHDAEHKNFKTLRVINEDFVTAQNGFGTHAHRDMNIITYIISGVLEHKDSMGNGSQIQAGEWQFMSAGSGVEHSEFNPSNDTPVHLLQIWIHTSTKGLVPRYKQLEKSPNLASLWRTVATGEESTDKIRLDQNAQIHHGKMAQEETKFFSMQKEKGIWIQMIRGLLDVNSHLLKLGDGIAIENEEKVQIVSKEKDTEFILFELF